MKRKWRIELAVLAVGAALALWTAGCEGDSLYEGVAIHPASIVSTSGTASAARPAARTTPNPSRSDKPCPPSSSGTQAVGSPTSVSTFHSGDFQSFPWLFRMA